MMDFFFKMALSNACIALVLAMAAVAVEATIRRPQLAYLLWLLVVVKLITPPLVTIPVVTELGAQAGPGLAPSELVVAAAGVETTSSVTTFLRIARPWVASIWLMGSGSILMGSLVRIARFDRLLRRESQMIWSSLTCILHPGPMQTPY